VVGEAVAVEILEAELVAGDAPQGSGTATSGSKPQPLLTCT